MRDVVFLRDEADQQTDLVEPTFHHRMTNESGPKTIIEGDEHVRQLGGNNRDLKQTTLETLSKRRYRDDDDGPGSKITVFLLS